MSDLIKALTDTVRGRVIVAADPDNLFHVNQNIAPAKRR